MFKPSAVRGPETRSEGIKVKSGKLYVRDWYFQDSWRQVKRDETKDDGPLWRFYGPVRPEPKGEKITLESEIKIFHAQ